MPAFTFIGSSLSKTYTCEFEITETKENTSFFFQVYQTANKKQVFDGSGIRGHIKDATGYIRENDITLTIDNLSISNLSCIDEVQAALKAFYRKINKRV